MSVPDASAAPLYIVPQDVCRDFERASRLEWLDTNHTGAYAMGTVAGVNTRRYHALLIASLKPPADRYSILSRVEERVVVGSEEFELAAVQYPGTVQPRGFELLEEFRLDPFPAWRYKLGAATLTKTLCLLDGQQSVLVRYETTRACRLSVRLLLSYRDYHSLTHENDALRTECKEEQGRVSFAPYPDLPHLTLIHDGVFRKDAVWFRNHEYLREFDRGLDFREDLFSPGELFFELSPERASWFLATIEPARFQIGLGDSEITSILAEEIKRRQFGAPDDFESTLRRAFDQFRVIRSDGQPSLIAGYPWFTDWSRDTLISLPALSAAGFPDHESADILTMLLNERYQGLLPNRFLDTHSAPEYNTADATLWLFIAAHDYLERTRDFEFLRATLYPACRDIVEWHRRGTLYNIKVDPGDHLLSAGDPGTQLTWMDAKIGDSAVTPRNGKPVELNALWYNALKILEKWSETLGFSEQQQLLNSEAETMLAAFRAKFWNAQRDCLYDVLTPASRDARIRPNQLFAISLPFPLLDQERARAIVAVVEKTLLTPVGLRTLDSGDPAYHPRFEGGVADRDAAYHQGTVWPWLIGPYISAFLYAYGESDDTIGVCRGIIARVRQELNICCLGSLSEVYDADPPHHPHGCPAQLWSVAQLIITLKRLHDRDRSSL